MNDDSVYEIMQEAWEEMITLYIYNTNKEYRGGKPLEQWIDEKLYSVRRFYDKQRLKAPYNLMPYDLNWITIHNRVMELIEPGEVERESIFPWPPY